MIMRVVDSGLHTIQFMLSWDLERLYVVASLVDLVNKGWV